jgi:hopanoid biosynthesis associated protein HpnK
LKEVILTGDDFGLAEPVNEAIIQAHRHGVLTTASLMVGAEYTQDAVERARETPSLKVGLHIVLVEGHSILAPAFIPNLVNQRGEFSTKLLLTGFKYFLHPRIRQQLEAEIRAQFKAFQNTGLSLDHVNAHNHMHLHPTILALIMKVGREFGLKAIRLPYEPPVRSWKASGKGLCSKLLSWIFLYPWIAMMKRRLHRTGIRHNDWLFGMADSGAMTLDLTLRFLQNLPSGITELHFHPATHRSREIEATMPDYTHEEEFKALTSERLLLAIQNAGIRRTSFGGMK